MESRYNLPLHHKLALTVQEALTYSHLSIRQLEKLLRQPDCPFLLRVGETKRLIKRAEFDKYLAQAVGA